MSNLKNDYLNSVIPKLKEEFKYNNIHQIPKIEKINVSDGLVLNAQNRVFLQKATEEIRLITGQQPVLTLAKKLIMLVIM
jgi:large subunit ribosomal protein L5